MARLIGRFAVSHKRPVFRRYFISLCTKRIDRHRGATLTDLPPHIEQRARLAIVITVSSSAKAWSGKSLLWRQVCALQMSSMPSRSWYDCRMVGGWVMARFQTG